MTARMNGMGAHTAGVGLLAATLLTAAVACGGANGGVEPSVTTDVSFPRPTRPHAPADVAAVRILAQPGTVLAHPDERSLDIHREPGTERPYMRLDTMNPWRQRLRLLVVNDARDAAGDLWLRVQLPIWPNGQKGWVSAQDVGLLAASERLVVDLSARRLMRIRGGDVVTRVPVAIGKISTPTPPGRFVVWAKVDTGQPSGPYGSYILGLSGFSDAIHPSGWSGLPRLAIHGTDDPSDAGLAISNGCIRVPNELMRRLRDVPMGTPVVIRR
jgi:lipoprotein-anchoring transpeptidase ErfK/SrfK